MFLPRARDIDDSTNDFGVKLAGQWADRLPGGLYPMDGTELRKVRSAQQQDPDLIALVTWMHGNRPPLDEVRVGSPDLQCYYQLLEYLYLDDAGILRIRQTSPEELPGGRLVIPLHSEIREGILEKGHNHKSHSYLEDRTASWKLTQCYFWPRMEVEFTQRSARCEICSAETVNQAQCTGTQEDTRDSGEYA